MNKDILNADFFRGNRKKLQSSLPSSMPIVITANGSLQRNGDVTFPFRQDSSFWYLTGLTKPDVLLVMDAEEEYLIIPEREKIVRQFDGADDISILSATSGVREVLYEKEGWRRLTSRLKRISSAATLAPSAPFLKKFGVYANPARARLVRQLKSRNRSLRLRDIRGSLVRMRAVKQPAELAAIQQAIDLTERALRQVHQKRQSYSRENEIEADITSIFLGAGQNHSFAPIVASGKNACTIHYVSNNSAVEKDGLLVMDIGAEVANYAADITRTYAVKMPSKRQQAVYDAVRETQLYGLSEIKPGILMKQLEDKVEQYIGEKLLLLGVIDRANHENIRQFYPHAVSHFLGLDVHDVGEYDKPLAPGMVVTCEPGIYLPEEGIGVRIEDDVLITENGNRILSEKIPVGL